MSARYLSGPSSPQKIVHAFLSLVLGAFVCGCGSSYPSYTVGGTVSGLSGRGLVLQTYGETLAVSANGSFTFSTPVQSGGPFSGAYNVTVATQPAAPPQTCAVAEGTGSASANVTSVQVVCTTNTYSIGGAVSGLAGGGLQLQDNGGNTLPINGNGNFEFATGVTSGTAYSVTVSAQPSSNPQQVCSVTNGSGIATANVSNVQVTCVIAKFTMGGAVINLAGTGGGLQLQDNGGDTLLINANGPFTFPTALLSSTSYTVTVSAPPSSPAQTCSVLNGTGVATANVTSVLVNCGLSDWTWMNGANVIAQKGMYGTEGQGTVGNTPGARASGAAWTDTSGNLWLFGGNGLDSTGASGSLNDLWEYSGGLWAWIGGSAAADEKGTYGMQKQPGAGNVPGARAGAVTWTDTSGNFWLFGGNGYDSNGNVGLLNDLWEYTGGQWVWMGGSALAGEKGTYGAQGQASANNIPGSRWGAVGWRDTSGNFWLFGGNGADSNGTDGYLDDLWEYSAGQWSWMAGSNIVDHAGVYGTQGVAGDNIPGARLFGASWIDRSGNFWLFGGLGYDSVGNLGYLNDLWEYSAGQWIWIGGASAANQGGAYGTPGIASAANAPGGRSSPVAWADKAGNFWLFGGQGYAATGNSGLLNDTWEYGAGQWTWMSGSNVIDQPGTYGTQGAPTQTSVPGARASAVGWTDTAGNFWLFGGSGYDSVGAEGFLNDLWQYKP